MSRSSYEQSIGNPLQFDRLPISRPTLEFRCHASGVLESAGIVLCWFICLVASSMLAWLVMQKKHALPTPPFFVPAFVIAAVWLLFADQPRETAMGNSESRIISRIIRNVHSRFSALISNVCVVYGLVAATVFVELPGSVHHVTAAIVLGNLLRAVCQHYVGYCSTSPMRRAEAWTLRSNCDWIVRGLSIWPTIVVILGHAFGIGMDLLLFSIIAASIAVIIIGRSNPAMILAAPGEAITQWCTYNLRCISVPGIYISPVGSWLQRLVLTAASAFLMSVAFFPSFWHNINTIVPASGMQTGNVAASGPRHADAETMFALMLATPVLLTIAIPIAITWPLLVLAKVREPAETSETSGAQLCFSNIRNSPDAIERDCIFVARVLADSSPMLVPRPVYHDHAHFLGDSGSGKTSLGLMPFCEQMIQFGDCSFVVIDLKADSKELLATMKRAAEAVKRATGKVLPVKHFTNQSDLSTYAFNPLSQPYWEKLDHATQADILCGAFGLNYGTDYGRGYFTSANAKVLQATVVAAEGAKTFRELADALETLLSQKRQKKLNKDIESAGLHAHMVLERLAAIDALNIDPRTAPDDVVAEQIDLTGLFQKPELLYFHLSSTLAPGMAPEIARNVIYSLLCSATLTQNRKCQVYLVIDEFQRIVAGNLEYILQLARSMNVGVILANQSMEDLRTRTTDLTPTLEANCRYRQWFAVSSSDDRARVVANSGETLEYFVTRTVSEHGESYTFVPKLMPRLSQNDVLLISDHPKQSIVILTRGEGYAQYGGMAVAVESEFHISHAEYQARRRMPWPDPGHGAFIPRILRAATPELTAPPGPRVPIVTIEIFGSKAVDDSASGSVNLPSRPGNGPKKPTAGKKRKDVK
jgi:hypothetical protein